MIAVSGPPLIRRARPGHMHACTADQCWGALPGGLGPGRRARVGCYVVRADGARARRQTEASPRQLMPTLPTVRWYERTAPLSGWGIIPRLRAAP